MISATTHLGARPNDDHKAATGSRSRMSSPTEVAHLTLLGGAELRRGSTNVHLPLGAHRLLSFLALQNRAVRRPIIAEALWPNLVAVRAAANLRSALWHARRIDAPAVVDCAGQRVRLSPGVRVDVHEVTCRAREIISVPSAKGCLTDYGALVEALSRGLLPTWSDEWVLIDRERWDQVRLHALEALARRLLAAEQHLSALEVALGAVAIEPVREGAHRAVIEIHLAEGNSACAIKHYQRYRALLRRELGVAPSQQMQRLIRAVASL